MFTTRTICATLALFASFCAFADVEVSLSDIEGTSEDAEGIANRTYSEEQTELQRRIFRNYNRRLRPVKNQSLPINVQLHIYLMHLSVDQLQQTMTVHGHIYMTWRDEIAVWDKADYNGVFQTMAKQWDIWTPDLRIANRVSGAGQYFEISKRSHATLVSNGPESTRVEIYPTFSIKMACKFDYSDYPYDEQSCALRLYTAQPMSEVQLTVYYNINPSVLLGWGSQSAKRHISDWELVEVTNNISYYADRSYSYKVPMTGAQISKTWSIHLTWVKVRRIALYYGIALVLPGLVSMVFNTLSFLSPNTDQSFYILVANFFLQAVFLQDFIYELPPAVGGKPRIVRFGEWILIETTVAVILNVWIRRLEAQNKRSTGKVAQFALRFVPGQSDIEPTDIDSNAPFLATIVKTSCAVFFFLFSVLMTAVCLL
uniref:Neur_chan_LBD domain-containing protein n=1 Tax=Steinernema glaseri TaxID=37863 RepID=A0A1I7ZHW3_9BILA